MPTSTAVTYRLSSHDHSTHEQSKNGHYHNNKTNGIKWDLLLEVNGETRRKNRVIGHLEENSGGTTAYLSPGVKFSAKGFGGFISVAIPIIENLKGKQTDVDSRIVAGISFAL
ncbi:MAG: hypothetical protein JKY12_00565 [Sneathiella sp.]|nr:hypothetical protein [Sneathiella sp.]